MSPHTTEQALLDARVAELAARYLPLAVEILREAIRIPADHVDRPVDGGGDPSCGLSNHEGPRLEYLRRRIVEIGAVRSARRRRLRRLRQPGLDGVGPRRRHRRRRRSASSTSTATATPSRRCGRRWREKLAAASTPTTASSTADASTATFLREELGYLPPDDEWDHLVFGRGAADQLGGVVAQVVATKILARARRRRRAARRHRARLRAPSPRRTTTAAARCTSMREVLPGRAGPS